MIRLGGVECHVCGQPADWWYDGLTLPCRCGQREWSDVDRAIAAVRRYITEGRG